MPITQQKRVHLSCINDMYSQFNHQLTKTAQCLWLCYKTNLIMIEDILKKAFYTGVGFLANPKGMKERIDDLVNNGDMTAEEGKKAFAEFEKDFKVKTDELESNIQSMVRTTLDKMDIPSKDKEVALEKRVKSLEVKVAKLAKELKEAKSEPTPTAKKTTTTRKKPAAKKATTTRKKPATKKTTTTRTKKKE